MHESPKRSPRLLFIPVSSPKGIGEYMRSLSIAQSLAATVKTADIRFVLSEEAPYLSTTPFRYFSCPSSPTKHSDLVKSFIDEFRPDIVIFDAAGRAEQLKHCAQLGIHTIFICQHRKKVSKGLGLRRLFNTNEIWVVQPSFAFSPLSYWSKLKLSIAKNCRFDVIGPVFHQLEPSYVQEVVDKYELQSDSYVLVNSGSGGHIVDGRSAAEEFARAAAMIAKFCDEKILLVYGPNYKGSLLNSAGVTSLRQIPAKEFAALLMRSKCAVIAGGSALFQAIVYQRNIVCCAVSKDQNERITSCENIGLASRAPLMAENIAELVNEKLKQTPVKRDLVIEDGLKIATGKLIALCNRMDML